MEDQPIKAEVVEGAVEAEEEPAKESVAHPTKLIRIASMTRAMLDEVRQAPVDERGRARLANAHRQSVEELREVLSEELLEEFDQVMVPLGDDAASEAEIRLAQAQLIGWLEGLFHGIQASLFTQQVAAQNQLAEMQRRTLAPPKPSSDDGSGLYL